MGCENGVILSMQLNDGLEEPPNQKDEDLRLPRSGIRGSRAVKQLVPCLHLDLVLLLDSPKNLALLLLLQIIVERSTNVASQVNVDFPSPLFRRQHHLLPLLLDLSIVFVVDKFLVLSGEDVVGDSSTRFGQISANQTSLQDCERVVGIEGSGRDFLGIGTSGLLEGIVKPPINLLIKGMMSMG